MSDSTVPTDPAMPAPSSAGDKVSLRTKLIYGLGTGNDMWGNWFYTALAYTVFNIYLGFPPKLIGIALSLRLIWDAITDPLFGWWSDNTRTRFGRRRPFILVGSILSGITLPFLFAVGTGWSDGAYFIWMLVSSMIFMTMVSCFTVPYQSLGAELSPDYRERTNIFTFKGCIQKVMEIGMFAAGAFATAIVWENATWADVPERLAIILSNLAHWASSTFVSLLSLDFSRFGELLNTPFGMESGDGNENVNVLLGAQVYATILGILMVAIGFVLFFGLKERYYDKVVQNSHTRVRIAETIWEALKCHPFRIQLSMAFAYSLGMSVVGTLGLYATIYYVSAGNLTEGNLWNLRMGFANMIFGFGGPIFFGFLAGKIDKRKTVLLIQTVAIAVFTATWWLYSPEVKWLQLLASGSIAFTQAGFWMLHGSIGADVYDYDELQNGNRREGTFTACGNYIMKIGMVIGTLITGFVLEATGFDADLGGAQSESSIFWIRFLLAAIPIAGLIASFTMMSRFPLTAAKMKDIKAQLEARRGTV